MSHNHDHTHAHDGQSRECGHDHKHAGHGHSGHSHSHLPPASADFSKAYAIGISLNLAFVVVEIICGLYSNSLALLADAGHNAGDVLGLFLAWGATRLSQRAPSAHYTYGLQSSSILAALANALLLFVACGGIGLEAIRRFSTPAETDSMMMIIVAGIGIAINGGTAMLFMSGQKTDLNIRGAFLHLVGDALVSLGVVISGILVMTTNWLWFDPLTSLAIATFIIISTWGLLRDSITLALHGTPRHIDTNEVKEFLTTRPEVRAVHDLHIWAMSTTETALSAHLVMQSGHPGDAALQNISQQLAQQFGIGHSTLQVELGDSPHDCSLAPDNVV